MMDPPEDDSTKSNLPPIPAVRRTTTTKTTTITRSSTTKRKEESSLESVTTTPLQSTEGLREKVARYEKVWSRSGGMHGDDNVIRVDVKDIEKRLQEEKERRFAESPSKVEFVKLRTTPQNTPGREYVAADSPFNVTLRHIEQVSSEEHRPDSPFNVTLRHVEKSSSEEREISITRTVENRMYTRRTPPRSIDLTAGGSKISIKFEGEEVDEVDRGFESPADIRVGSSGFRNLATQSNVVIDDGNRHTPQRISKTFIKSPTLTTISSPFQSTKKVSSVYVKNLQGGTGSVTSPVSPANPGSGIIGSVSVSASESSSRDDLSEEASEWYNDYRNQSFNSTMIARQFARTNSQYDNHIKEIRGGFLRFIS